MEGVLKSSINIGTQFLPLISSLLGFGVLYVAGRSITQTWMKKSGVEDFDNVVCVRVYAITKKYALIIYDANIALWKDDLLIVYGSIHLQGVTTLVGQRERAMAINTRDGWYGLMEVTPEKQTLQYFESIVEALDVTDVILEADSESNILNILNMLIERDIIN
jgi:hypothetical protein